MARVAARALHVSAGSEGKVIPYLLTDIGEGNAEAEVLEWFVQPGDTVSMFDPIVNVQSDKVRVPLAGARCQRARRRASCGPDCVQLLSACRPASCAWPGCHRHHEPV